MSGLEDLFANNRRWAARVTAAQPGFFARLAGQQAPRYLWIGCSDSRLPPNDILGLMPGELFVHRNVGNVVVHTDFNCLAVLEYAVQVLGVEHVIVCGHFGCGGVRAALDGPRPGPAGSWVRHIRDVRDRHRESLEGLDDETQWRRLCEVNVVEQAANVCSTGVVREVWAARRGLSVHGVIYALGDGLLRDVGVSASTPAEAEARRRTALERILAPARDAER